MSAAAKNGKARPPHVRVASEAHHGVARRERLRLCDLFEELGPGAPTLCEGWANHDLAAHLVVRESRPLALPGLVLTPMHPLTERFEREMRQRPFGELVARLRSGPPLLGGVLGMPGLRDAGNVHEFFVHHEDVRRPAGLGPRSLEGDLDAALWLRLRLFGPFLARTLRGLRVRLETPDGRAMTVLPGRSELMLRGDSGELFLFLFNRRSAAQVDVSGDPSAVARLSRERLGL